MKLAEADILKLLPEHISGDPQFAAAADAANPVLSAISKAIPNLLLWARLGGQKPETFLPPLRRLTDARPGLSPLDLETLESLAWQFHVDFREVAKSNAQLAELILKSIAWHRIKGTPRSMYDALILCGFDTRYSQNGRMDAASRASGARQAPRSLQAARSGGQEGRPLGIYIEEGGPQVHWATYQLGFEEIAAYEDLKSILKICWEMQPARCRLWRVYTFDYDLRPGVWSGPLPQNAWSNAWWSLWSGSYMPEFPGLDERGLLVSWGKRQRLLCEQWSADRRVIALQEKLRVLRIFGHVIPRWSEAYWSDFVFAKPPAFVVWNGHGLLIGELMGGEVWPGEPWKNAVWQDAPWSTGCWPDHDWGGYIHNLVGKFLAGNRGINTILVSPPDYWPVWPGEVWPPEPWRKEIWTETVWPEADWRFANWLYGHAGGWRDEPWSNQDWLAPLRLINGPFESNVVSIFCATVFDWSLQEAWSDKTWGENTWSNGFPNLAGDFQIGSHCGNPILVEPPGYWPVWPDESWPDANWLYGHENGWAELPWPQKDWADPSHNLVGQFQIGNCGINTIQVSPPDFWPDWRDTPWPGENWFYGHAGGWPEKPWRNDDWLKERRLLNPRPITVFASDLVTTVFDPSLQDVWPDASWADSMWMNLFCIGKKSLFQCEQLFAAQVGEISWERNFWTGEIWPERVWADSWRLVQAENIAGDFGAAASAIFTAAVFPNDFYQTWPEIAWPQKAWDDAFHQIRPEIGIALEAGLRIVANSDSAQPAWPDLPWQAEAWFSPKTLGAKTSFKIISEISPDALWLDTPWQPCAWRQMEDA